MPIKFSAAMTMRGGRMNPIPGSRPTMMVLVWWRAWLHRQAVGLRITMKLAI